MSTNTLQYAFCFEVFICYSQYVSLPWFPKQCLDLTTCIIIFKQFHLVCQYSLLFWWPKWKTNISWNVKWIVGLYLPPHQCGVLTSDSWYFCHETYFCSSTFSSEDNSTSYAWKKSSTQVNDKISYRNDKISYTKLWKDHENGIPLKKQNKIK